MKNNIFRDFEGLDQLEHLLFLHYRDINISHYLSSRQFPPLTSSSQWWNYWLLSFLPQLFLLPFCLLVGPSHLGNKPSNRGLINLTSIGKSISARTSLGLTMSLEILAALSSQNVNLSCDSNPLTLSLSLFFSNPLFLTSTANICYSQSNITSDRGLPRCPRNDLKSSIGA